MYIYIYITKILKKGIFEPSETKLRRSSPRYNVTTFERNVNSFSRNNSRRTRRKGGEGRGAIAGTMGKE